MTLCREVLLVKHQPNKKTVRCLKCRSWGCELCLPDRIYQLKKLCRSGKPQTFLTLTYNAKRPGTPDEHARDLARAWRLLRKRIEKRYNLKRIPYLTVFEATAQGEPHLHIMLRIKYIPQSWISEQMADLIDSPIVDIKHIYNEKKAAWYIAKYISKGPKVFQGCKRYFRSQNYVVEDQKWQKEPLRWDEFYTRHTTTMERYIEEMISLGWHKTEEKNQTILRKGVPPPARTKNALAFF